MLTAELKVNGVLIGVLYIHNLTGEPTSEYEVLYHEISSKEAPFSGRFKHQRKDGGIVCVEKALKAVRKV